jgi:hypothetical protein
MASPLPAAAPNTRAAVSKSPVTYIATEAPASNSQQFLDRSTFSFRTTWTNASPDSSPETRSSQFANSRTNLQPQYPAHVASPRLDMRSPVSSPAMQRTASVVSQATLRSPTLVSSLAASPWAATFARLKQGKETSVRGVDADVEEYDI